MSVNSRVKTLSILQLAVPSPLRRTFDYLPPNGVSRDKLNSLKPGMRIKVPFGSRKVIAILMGISNKSNIEHHRLREALEIVDQQPLFSPALMASFRWAINYYQHPPGDVFATLLPTRLRAGDPILAPPVSAWKMSPAAEASLISLHRSPRQSELLQLIKTQGSITRQQCQSAGFTSTQLKALLGKGLIQEIRIPDPAATAMDTDADGQVASPHQPNDEQQQAINHINGKLGQFHCHLLEGITGSGKTEVYLQVIAKILESGGQALVLVPEIGLTPQTIATFTSRFSHNLVTLHSGMSDTQRLQAWRKARSGFADIVIGTRSAIFTPLARPGIIIIDEEHDSSFKQQDGFKYSARDLAVIRAREENINVVLGSATPAMESLYNAQNGKYSHLVLSRRAGDALPPKVSLVDTAIETCREGISPSVLDTIKAELQKGNQVLVFINRRGFAPYLFCQDCGFHFECQRCDAQLTVHKKPPSLHCHHCESRVPLPNSCPSCQSNRLATRGMGTEKTEQLLQTEFADVPVLRVDRDSTRRSGQLQSILDQVLLGCPCILVGTQILAKGHHFPKVTLVAVLDADGGLFSPDFRGQEHMVQLLFQVSGRAGRAKQPGQVLVQTRHAKHPLLQVLEQGDYSAIANLLLAERQQANLPPYSHLALLKADAPAPLSPINLLQSFNALCQQHLASDRYPAVTAHAPLPSPMEKRGNRYRAQMLIEADSRGVLNAFLKLICEHIDTMKFDHRFRWSIDVDPQDLI